MRFSRLLPIALALGVFYATAASAQQHFERLLEFETDCWDVHAALSAGGAAVPLSRNSVVCARTTGHGSMRSALIFSCTPPQISLKGFGV